jgi:hypothetical protein
MARKEGKEGSEIVKEGDKCPHCNSTLMVALVCKDDNCGTVVHPADGYNVQPGSRHVRGVRYADRVTFSGFLSELTDSMVTFLNLQPKNKDGHVVLQDCDEMEIDISAHLIENPQDAPFLETITKALEDGDGTLELALSG